ncbi:MAG: DUF5717 family protein, partial [Clostridiales bacterium]|nr:DUF5717 family protein [Clostridiales bacterium]
VMLQLDDSYERNPQRKYDAIRQFMGSSTSPVFYYEAAKLIGEHPELLDAHADFDSRLLGWMSRKNLLTHDLALRIEDMALGRQRFNRNYLRVLSKCYKKFGDESFVKAICVYLIHTNRYGETYFPWFKRGVERHLKIAGLYEAYILSWSRSQGELPPEVVRYFSMNSTLPSRRKAMLFAYIVRNKNRLGNDWNAYMGLVQDFAVSELSKGHMNDDLAIIYEEVRRMMPASDWDKIKGDCENCYKVYVGSTDFAAVRVMQNAPKTINSRVPISGECAYIYLYRKPYIILFEGKDDQVYGSGKDCRVSKMLSGSYLDETSESKRERIKPTPGPQDSIDEAVRLENMAGSIDEMSELLVNVQATGAPVTKYAQQLMIRMLFTEHLGEHHQEIFSILRRDRDSEELLCAYSSILCRNYMINNVAFNEEVYLFLWERLSRKKDSNPWYMAAYLRMYTESAENIYSEMAEAILKEYIFAGAYFPFFEKLPVQIKRKYLLMGINVVYYTAEPGEVFYVNIKDGPRETLAEVLPGLYSYAFRLLPGEIFEYSILDRDGRIHLRGEIEEPAQSEGYDDTRYSRLGELLENRLDDASRFAYAETCDLVDTLFIPVKE